MNITNSAASWNGSGLPTSGTRVEIHRGHAEWFEKDEWQIGKTAVVMSAFTNSLGHGIAAIEFPSGHCECIISDCLKPIRTPEQIAAEERNAAQKEIEHIILTAFNVDKVTAAGIAGVIADSKYRKQVTP